MEWLCKQRARLLILGGFLTEKEMNIIHKLKKEKKKTKSFKGILSSEAKSLSATCFKMQRRVRPCFKQRGMSLCFYSYLPLFRFRLSRWIFLLPANLHLLAGRWPFRMTVWVWHEPRKMNRGEPRPPSVPGPSAARGTCTLGGLKMQKGKLVKY